MNTFHKKERLNNHSLIRRLFTEGVSVYVHPFKIFLRLTELETQFPAQVLISVPKRYFKKAVDRNHIKRLFRESYRLNKNDLYQDLEKANVQLSIGFVYTHKAIPDFAKVNHSIKKAIPKIIKQIEKELEKE